MPQPSTPVDVALPSIGRGPDALPRQQQVYAAVRDLVLSGRFEEGARLPSSRRLAGAFAVARNTVLVALERLCAEQLIACRRGSGCRVLAPAGLVREARANRLERPTEQPSTAGRIRPFNATVPALADFPLDLWARLVRRRWRSASPAMLGYSPPGGYQPLREAIADRLSVPAATDADCGLRPCRRGTNPDRREATGGARVTRPGHGRESSQTPANRSPQE